MCKERPTVVVYVKDDSSCDWDTFVGSLRDITDPVKLNIQLQPARLTALGAPRLESDGKWKNCRTDGTFSASPSNGASICSEDSSSCGTLGGFVILETNQTQYRCALTNYHVIKPLPGKLADQTFSNGISLPGTTGVQHSPRIVYPASNDLDASIETLTARLSDSSQKEDPEVLDTWRTNLQTCQKLKGNPTIGSLIAASGVHTCRVPNCGTSAEEFKQPADGPPFSETCLDDHHIRDSALIKLDSRIPITNHPPPKQKLRDMDDLVPKSWDYRAVTRIAPMQPHQWVCKEGRSTGVTEGYVLGRQPFYRTFEPSGTDIRTMSYVDWVVAPSFYQLFSSAGDSGSFLYNKAGEVVGFLHSGIEFGGDRGHGIVSSMVDVVRDIELATNGKIRLPGEPSWGESLWSRFSAVKGSLFGL
ncbi:hypothetical protein MMC17_005735 [Xylographa soralifera]|nr:hypothetical protein [Xylographa soralifera]